MACTQGLFYVVLGKKVALARRAARLKQNQLAEHVGLSRTSITNIESGRQPVQVHLLVELAGVLGVDLASLLPTPNELRDDYLSSGLDVETQQWVARVMASGGD